MIQTLLFAVTGLVMAASPALAQSPDKSTNRPSLEQQRALIQSLPRGQRFTTDGVEYDYLTDVRAVRAPKRQTPQQLLPRVGAQPGDLVKHSGSLMYIRRSGRGVLTASVETMNQQTLLPTAVNARTGQLVMLTGSIIAQPKNMDHARQLATDYGLLLTGTAPDIGTAFYEVRPGRDVLAAARALANDGRVSKAEPEVISALREPK